jgi:hypothetical protein
MHNRNLARRSSKGDEAQFDPEAKRLSKSDMARIAADGIVHGHALDTLCAFEYSPHDSLILIADFDRIRWASVHSLAEIYVATCASCQIRGGDLGHPVGVLLSVEPELGCSSD